MRSQASVDPLRRLRALAWLLDQSIPLPGGFRIGLDPIIGLVPGFGDAIAAILAAAIVEGARRSGVPTSVLLRMIGNVLADAAVGSVPILGDVFDAAFKANVRNLALLERHRADPRRTQRKSALVVLGVASLLVLAVLLMIALPIVVVIALAKLL